MNNPFTIAETNTCDVKISPVPAKDVVFVTGNDLKQAVIVNSLGQTVATGKYDDTHITIDIHHLPANIYFVAVTDQEGRSYVKKMVKQ